MCFSSRPALSRSESGDSGLAGGERFLGAQRGGPLPSILQSALDVTWSGAAGDVVQSEHFSKSEAGVETRVKAGVDRLQVRERQFL